MGQNLHICFTVSLTVKFSFFYAFPKYSETRDILEPGNQLICFIMPTIIGASTKHILKL